MRHKITLLLLELFVTCTLLFGQTQINSTPIKFTTTETSYVKRNLQEGIPFFTNRVYLIVNLNRELIGWEILSNAGGNPETGEIEALADGYLYGYAKKGGISGWTEVINSTIILPGSELCLYSLKVDKGDIINIPYLSNFQGFTPVASNIEWGKAATEVSGYALDIVSPSTDQRTYVQNDNFKYKSIPTELENMQAVSSTSNSVGPEKFRSDKACTVYCALNGKATNIRNWQETGLSVIVNKYTLGIYTGLLYLNVYRYDYRENEIDSWVSMPIGNSNEPVCRILFADSLFCGNLPTLPGTVITRSQHPKGNFITNPSITILPDGDYLASCTGAYRIPGTTNPGVSFFLSKDKGATWQTQSINNGLMSYQNLFVHNENLYVLGTNKVQGDIIIRRSLDKGVTWTYPTDTEPGLLRKGEFHSAPVPMIIHNNRIWRGFETNPTGGKKQAFVMSAPIDADLMDAASWTFTNSLDYNTSWISGDGKTFKDWLEGNVVVDPDGNVVNIMRVDEEKFGGKAAILHVNSPTEITFNPNEDIINFPGGGKKFTIRFDTQTQSYWTISNAEFDNDRYKTQPGIYFSGTHCGLLRNRLVLMQSKDLRNWTIMDTLISSENPFINGYQYIDWQFEGEDIIAVSRTAMQDERGVPVRQHDGTYFLFHRFINFRGITNSTATPILDNDAIIFYKNQLIHVIPKTEETFTLKITSTSGCIVYNQTNCRGELSIETSSLSKGVYIIELQTKTNSKSKKLILN